MSFDPKTLSRFPKEPGVYLMKDSLESVLYVGKAKSLKARLKQYFTPGADSRAIIPYLTSQIATIDTIIVNSEKEALILENNLIKKYQPKYNALLKDDKTFFSLGINHKHQWPSVRVVRYKGKPPAGHLYFGPYTNGYAARQTLELLEHLFPLRQCSDRELLNRSRPCILYDLKRCIAPCVGKCSKEDYDALVNQVIQFLKGHDSVVLKDLKNQLQLAIDHLEFEKADRILSTIGHIESTLETQKVQKIDHEDFDALGLFRLGSEVIITQLFFREGKLLGSHDHLFTSNAQEDEELLGSFLLQHYLDPEQMPKEILVPFEPSEKAVLEELLSEVKKQKVFLASPKKGAKKTMLEMAEKNAQARFSREKEEKNVKEQLLIALEEELHLTNYPEKIECFDNSNIGGTEPVSALVAFVDGKRDPKLTRKYKLKTVEPSDDYGAMREALTRRYKRAIEEEENLPDLLIIDGGKGHLGIALEVLENLDISTIDVIGVSKEEGKHTKGMTLERVFIPSCEDPIMLKKTSPLLLFLQHVRDEAHRVAISFQRVRRGKKSLGSSLDAIPGIGPVKRKRLLTHFGSVKRLKEAPESQWKEVKGISQKDIESLKKWLRSSSEKKPNDWI